MQQWAATLLHSFPFHFTSGSGGKQCRATHTQMHFSLGKYLVCVTTSAIVHICKSNNGTARAPKPAGFVLLCWHMSGSRSETGRAEGSAGISEHHSPPLGARLGAVLASQSITRCLWGSDRHMGFGGHSCLLHSEAESDGCWSTTTLLFSAESQMCDCPCPIAQRTQDKDAKCNPLIPKQIHFSTKLNACPVDNCTGTFLSKHQAVQCYFAGFML